MTVEPDPTPGTDGAEEAVDGAGDDRGRYKIVFEGELCIATGRCAEVSDNWTMDLGSGVARPRSHYVDEEDLAQDLEAARVCPAKNGDGVIRVVDTATGDEVPLDGAGAVGGTDG